MKTSRSLLIAGSVIAVALASFAPGVLAQGDGNRSGSVPQRGVLKSGPLPDLNAFTAEGKPLKVRELCKGSYTVLKSGCLTCPEFHRSYLEFEAASADYAPKGVKFFYFYKSLPPSRTGGLCAGAEHSGTSAATRRGAQHSLCPRESRCEYLWL